LLDSAQVHNSISHKRETSATAICQSEIITPHSRVIAGSSSHMQQYGKKLGHRTVEIGFHNMTFSGIPNIFTPCRTMIKPPISKRCAGGP
jgi:hypothetical protein